MISYLKLFNKQKSEAQQLLININKKSNNDIRLDDVKFKFNITTNILDQINKMLELNDLKYNKNSKVIKGLYRVPIHKIYIRYEKPKL